MLADYGFVTIRLTHDGKENLFDRFFRGLPEDFGPERPWELDVREDAGEVVVRAELPGFEAGDLAG